MPRPPRCRARARRRPVQCSRRAIDERRDGDERRGRVSQARRRQLVVDEPGERRRRATGCSRSAALTGPVRLPAAPGVQNVHAVVRHDDRRDQHGREEGQRRAAGVAHSVRRRAR